MKLSRTFQRLWLGAATLLLVCVAVQADTIKLKDGSVYKGKVVGYGQRKFTIIVYVGSSSSQHVISADEVESIEFDAEGAAPRPVALSENTRGAEAVVPRVEPRPEPQAEAPRLEPVRGAAPTTRPVEPPLTDLAPPLTAAPDLAATEAGAAGEKTISVAAAADWTSTEVRVQRGQRVLITATGEIDLGNNQRSSPDGVPLRDQKKLMTERPTGGLIAVIGDDNNDFVFVGNGGEFVASRSGILFLSVNEDNLKDNSGAYIARVKVLPGK